MGAQSISTAKSPATASRVAAKPSHARTAAHAPPQQEHDAKQAVLLPATFGSIPTQASGEDAGPTLLVQRKCATCTTEEDEQREIHRKPLLSTLPAADLFLQRKCEACASEDESEHVSVQRKPVAAAHGSSAQVLIQRKCSACKAEEQEERSQLHRKSLGTEVDSLAQNPSRSRPEQLVREAMRHSAGQPLAPSVRKHMEHAYGTDLGNVRIHTDALANQASQAVAAQAYTLGQSIYFGPGRYQPHSTAGRELLAHELAHVIQNRRGHTSSPSRKRSMQISTPHDANEQEADAAARAVLAGRTFTVRGSGSSTLHRKDLLDTAIDWGKTKVDQAESAVGSGIKEAAEFTGEQLIALVRTVAPGLADIISEGPVNYAKRKVSEALDAHMPDALGGFSLSELGRGIGSWLGEAKDFVKGLAKGGEQACQKFAGFMKKLADFVGKLIDNPVVDAVTSVFDKATAFVTKALKVIGEPLFDGLKNYVSGAWSALKKVAGTVSDWFTKAKNALGSLWTRLMSLLGFDGSSEDGVWSWIKGHAAKVWDGIKAAVQPVIEPLKKVASVIALLTPMGQIHAIIKYGPKVVEVLKWIWQNGLDPQKIRDAPAEIRDMLQTVGSNVDGFKGKLQEGTDWLSDKMSSLADAVLDVASKISGLPLVSFAHQMFEDARAGLKTLVKDIKEGAEKAVTAIEDVGKKIADFVEPYKDVISSVILAIASPPMIPVILAGWAWQKLPKCIKLPILDFVLDIAIKAISKIPGVPTFGLLWPLLKPGVLAFLETLRAADEKVKEEVSNKIAKIISGASPEFLIAFVKGFLQGIWEGITDPLKAIWTVMEGLDKATQYLLSLAGLEDKDAPSPPLFEEEVVLHEVVILHAVPRQELSATTAPTASASATPAPAHAETLTSGHAAKANPSPAAAPAPAHAETFTKQPAAAPVSATPSGISATPSLKATAPVSGAEHESAASRLGPAELAAIKAAAGDTAKAVGPHVAIVKGNFWGAVQEYFNGSSITFDQMVQRLSETWEAAKAKISEGGAWLANELMTFFKGDGAEAEIGDKVGWLSGTLVFQVVLDAITAGTWTEADSILVGIAKFINWPMEALGEAFKLLKSLGKYLLEGLKSLGSAIKETAAGAFKAVSKAIGSIGEKLLAFGEQILGKFGGKAAKAETKATGLLGKEATSLTEREGAKLGTTAAREESEQAAKQLEKRASSGEQAGREVKPEGKEPHEPVKGEEVQDPEAGRSQKKAEEGSKEHPGENNLRKEAELGAATAEAKAIMTADSAIGIPVPGLIAQLMGLKLQYSWIKSFEAQPKGNHHFAIHMLASDHDLGDYHPKDFDPKLDEEIQKRLDALMDSPQAESYLVIRKGEARMRKIAETADVNSKEAEKLLRELEEDIAHAHGGGLPRPANAANQEVGAVKSEIRKGTLAEKGDSNVTQNLAEGGRRQTQTQAELINKYKGKPGVSVQQEHYLLDAKGNRVIDSSTGEARRLDHVVIDNGKVVEVVETTSLGARKSGQLNKETRIMDTGGTYIRDKETGQILDTSGAARSLRRWE